MRSQPIVLRLFCLVVVVVVVVVVVAVVVVAAISISPFLQNMCPLGFHWISGLSLGFLRVP